jgi:hypothetical protein
MAGQAPHDVDEAVDQLYALPPDQFVGSRDVLAAAARAAGDAKLAADIRKLRKPTVSAWAVNILSRRAEETLRALLDLGPARAKAQRLGRRDDLRSLGEARHRYVAALVAAAGKAFAEHGHPMSAAIALDVESTLAGALADGEVADAVLAGRLDRPVRYAGLGPIPALRLVPTEAAEEAAEPGRAAEKGQVPPDHAIAAGPAESKDKREAAAVGVFRGPPGPDLDELTADVDLATQRREKVLAEERRLDEERTRLRREYDDLRARLQNLEAEIRAADRAANQTHRDVGRAERDLERAKRVLDRAQARTGRRRATDGEEY